MFEAESFRAAARSLASERGPAAVTVDSITARLGAPKGSFYHRFASRDVLLGELWLATVLAYQEGFMAAIEAGDRCIDFDLFADPSALTAQRNVEDRLEAEQILRRAPPEVAVALRLIYLNDEPVEAVVVRSGQEPIVVNLDIAEASEFPIPFHPRPGESK